MGQSASPVTALPPLPPGATLNSAQPSASTTALPPLPPGATLNTPSPAAAPADFTSNPNGEGVYQMLGAQGKINVPYSKVDLASQEGMSLSPADAPRYAKDIAADTQRNQQADQLAGQIDPHMGLERGAIKDALQMPNTVLGWLDSLSNKAQHAVEGPNAKPEASWKEGAENLENRVMPGITQPVHGAGEMTGAFASEMAQWLYGEGEAKAAYQALPMAQKLKKIAASVEFFEKHPAIAKVAAAGIRNGATAVGAGAQSLLHGASPSEAAENAAITGGLGAAVTGGLGIVAPRAAAALLPKVSAADQVSAKLDEMLNAIGPHVSKEDTGKAVRSVVDQLHDVATQKANEAYNPLKQPLGLPDNATRAEINTAAQDAAQPKKSSLVGADGKPMMTPGDGGAALDALQKADEAYAQSRQAINTALIKKIAKSDKPELAYQYIAKASLGDMRSLLPSLDEETRSAVARNVLSDVVNAGGAPENFNANAALKAFARLDKDGPKSNLLFGDGASQIKNNLQSIAEATATTTKRLQFSDAVKSIATQLSHAAFVGGVAGEATGVGYKAGGIAGMALTSAAYVPRVMRAVIENPKIAQNILFALDAGANPKNYAPLIAGLIANDTNNANDQQEPKP